MSLTPLFSIIVPFYNVRAYMDRCIRSLIKQTYSQLELIFIDDGSTDGTGERLDYWAQSDSRIQIFHRENHGVSETRNFGLQQVIGEYLTFVDGDDWVERQFIEFMVKAFQDSHAAMVVCGYYLDPRGRSAALQAESGILTRKEMLSRVLKLTGSVRGYTWNKGYLTSVIQQHRLEFTSDIDLMEDQLFNVQYINLTRNFYFDTQPLYHYVQRADSLVHAFDLQKVPDTVVANYRILQELNHTNAAEQSVKKHGRQQKKQLKYRKSNLKRAKDLKSLSK